MKNYHTKLHTSRFGTSVTLALTLTLGITVSNMSAVPVPVSGPVAGPGNGVNSEWVQVDSAHRPLSIAQALDVMAMQPGDAGFISRVQIPETTINYGEGLWENGNYLVPPFPVNAYFAVTFVGYLNITRSGWYQFALGSDDGCRFMLGGDQIAAFDGGRAYNFSYSSWLNLTAGLYPIEVLSWDQGGGYGTINWAIYSGESFHIIPKTDYFSEIPSTPENGHSFALLVTALFSVGVLRTTLRQKLGFA